MNENAEEKRDDTATPISETDRPATSRLKWVDVNQRPWDIELAPEHIVLRSGDDVIDLPAGSWATDLYVAEHADSCIVRIERFELGVSFMLTKKLAEPFLKHVAGIGAATPPANVEEVEPPVERARPVLWPKVSPLAVWALICSSLVFVPVLGLLAAVVTITLLWLHGKVVRRAPAWGHSRKLCQVASVLLVVGLLVSVLSTWGILQTFDVREDAHLFSGSPTPERNWGVIAAALCVVLFALTVHEAAHAISAWWLGDDLARSMGRVTLNPLAHIDPFGTILLPLILVLMGGAVFGYARPVPVRVELLTRRRRAHILISLAGPGSNMLIAAISFMLLMMLSCTLRLAVPQAVVDNLASLSLAVPVTASGFMLAPVFGSLCTILKLSFFINTVLAMFNLIPIPPLDGTWVLEHLFPNSLGRLYATIRPYGFLIFIGLIYYTDLFEYFIIPLYAFWLLALSLLAVATGF